MARPPSGSSHHRIFKIFGFYRLSWRIAHKNSGSRLLSYRVCTRDTDEAGALRFAKRWNVGMPK